MDLLDSFGRQLGVESGNRQFNTDGSVVRSPKGAVGAAQLMPAAAKEGAAYAGLPYDPQRIITDGNYNRAVGAGYKAKLLDRFGGDDRAATAAYNGGPTRIAGLQAQYGANWEAHLTGESHDYLDNVLGSLGGATTPQQTQAASSTTPPANLQTDPKVSAAKDAVTQGDQQYGDVLSAASATIKTIQAKQIDDASKMVQSKDAILDDIGAQTQQMSDQIRPVFAKRAAIAHRITELDTMNPFKKAILGLVNPNYDADELQKRDSHLAAEAAAISDEYKSNTQMQSTLMDVVSGHYQNQEILNQLHMANVNTDLGIADKQMNQVRQQFEDAVNGVQSDAQIASAKSSLRTDALSQMDPGQLNVAGAQAARGGGFATINGVPISHAEILHRQQQLTEQDLAVQGAVIGNQSASMSLVRNQQERLINSMSPADIKSAQANGGMFKGVQIPSDLLTAGLANSIRQNDLVTGDTAEGANAQTYAQTVDGFNASTQDVMRRVTQVTGAKLPPILQQHFLSAIQQINARSAAIRSAPTPEAANKLRAGFVGDVQTLQQGTYAAIDKSVTAMTDNKDAQVVLKGFMTGQQPTGEQATRGMIAMVTGGALPPGVKLSGPAAIAMNAARSAVRSVYAKYSPKAPNANPTQADMAALMAGSGAGGKPNAAQFNQELRESVQRAVSTAWTQSTVDQAMNNLPQMAQADGHAAGRINPTDYRAAQAAGDQQGKEATATRLGFSDVQMDNIFGPNGGKAAFDATYKGKDGLSFAQAQQSLAAVQTQYFLRNLDSSPSASHNMKPSAAIVDYMTSPKFQQRVGAFTSQVPHQGLGEMLADSVSGGSVGQVLYQHANQMSQAQGANEIQDQTNLRKRVDQYNGSPIKRTSIILSAIPGLNQGDQSTLLKALTQGISDPGMMASAAMNAPFRGPVGDAVSLYTGAEGRSAVNKIDSLVLHGKFQDPHLEKLRQLAAKHWVPMSTASDGIVQRLMNSIVGGF